MSAGHYIECGSTKTHDAHSWRPTLTGPRAWCPGHFAPVPDIRLAEIGTLDAAKITVRPRRPMLATRATAHNIGGLEAAAFTAQTLVQALAEKARREEVEVDWAEAEFTALYDPAMMRDEMALKAPIKERMKRL